MPNSRSNIPATPTNTLRTTGQAAKDTATTHFGRRQIPIEQKRDLVQGVFDRVATRYDIMNDMMSGGLHRLWKRTLVAMLNPQAGWHILDVAGGTGDIAFRIQACLEGQTQQRTRSVMQARTETQAHVTVCDINARMIDVGRDRSIDRGLVQPLSWVVGDASTLPFPDRTFDAWTCAFGVRNMTDIDQVLREAYRVLKPGGQFICLEFTPVQSAFLAPFYDVYSFQVLPRMGAIIARDRESYQYLAESIRTFPHTHTFKTMIENAGFARVRFRQMSGGIVALHSGFKA